MGGGSKSSSQPPPPPTPTPDIDVAASAAEQALMGQQVQSYKTALEDERKKAETGTLGMPAKSGGEGYGMKPQARKRPSGASMMRPQGTGALPTSGVLTG